MTNELDVQPGETAEQFKLRIEKKQAELASPLPEGKTPQPTEFGNQNDTASKKNGLSNSEPPQPINPAENASPAKNGKPEGDTSASRQLPPKFKSVDELIRGYRAMEEEFHRRNQGKWNQQTGSVNPTPQPNVPQSPTSGDLSRANDYSRNTPPPAPTMVPQLPPQAIQELARVYNIPPDDVQRLYAFNRDQMDVMLRQALAERDRYWESKLKPIDVETKRNSEFRRLMQDPAFQNPEVHEEMSRILNEDKEAIGRENEPFEWAYNRALQNIGRKRLQGNVDVTVNGLPTAPPKSSDRTSGERESNGMSQVDFAKLSADDQRAYLRSLGLVQPKY